MVLGALLLTTAGGLTVRGRPLLFAAAPRPAAEAEPEVDLAAARAESARQERAIRAFHRRDLRRHPDQSQPHAWATFDLLRDVLDRAQTALVLGTQRSSAPMSEFSRQRQIYEQRQVQLENYIAAHYPRETRRAFRHAEKAFRFAATPVEEMQARRLLGDAYRLAGRYDSAIRQFLWLASIDPYGDRGMLQRCYTHKGLRMRWENRGGSYWAYVGGRPWPIGVRSVEAFIVANQRWARRWPHAAILRARLGTYYYSLALQEAVEQADFPRPGREFGKRVDACICRHSRHRVAEGMRHFQASLELAEKSGDRARALTELGHGYLMYADYGRAIRLLKRALAEEPWNRSAQEYLRQAYRRLGRGHDRVITALRPPPGWYAENYGGLAVNSGFAGYGTGIYRLSSDEAREAHDLLTLLRRSSQERHEEAGRPSPRRPIADDRLQEARNRLDELLPGSGSRYHSVTGDVLVADLDRAAARLEQLRLSGAIYPSPGR